MLLSKVYVRLDQPLTAVDVYTEVPIKVIGLHVYRFKKKKEKKGKV